MRADAARACRRLAADRRGAAALEFAMAGLTMVILLLAVFNIALLFMAKRGLDYGIYRAARWATVNSSSDSVATILAQFQTYAGAMLPNATSCQGYAAGSGVPAGTVCAVTVGFSSGTAVGSVVTIQASYTWSPISPVTGLAVTTLQSTIALALQH